jgi:hydroxyacylglutathione hydrolase
MRQHLSGSLYAPLDRTFPTVAGSYVDPRSTVYLIVDERAVEEAVRSLVRIGIDSIGGWAPPDAIEAAAEVGAQLDSVDEIDISEVEARRERDRGVVVDVRRLSEHLEGGVPGSVHFPHTRLAERLADLPQGKKLLVHCRTGARSAVASAFLKRHGFDVVYVNGTLEGREN